MISKKEKRQKHAFKNKTRRKKYDSLNTNMYGVNQKITLRNTINN